MTFSLTKKSKKALRYARRRLKVAGLISSEKYSRMQALSFFLSVESIRKALEEHRNTELIIVDSAEVSLLLSFQKEIALKDLLILVLPSLLTAIFSWLGIDRIKFQRYQRLIEIAKEAVLYADDYYPESTGVDKLKEAIEYFKNAAQKAGFWVSDKEAEEKVRIAYQALERRALSNLAKQLMGE